jgi:hypothetical protein
MDGKSGTTVNRGRDDGKSGKVNRGQPESLSERNISELGINNLQTLYCLYLVDSSFQKIYLRQAPEEPVGEKLRWEVMFASSECRNGNH